MANNSGVPLEADQWNQVSPADFQAFCFTDGSIKILGDISPTTTTSVSSSTRVSDLVAEFKKGIK